LCYDFNKKDILKVQGSILVSIPPKEGWFVSGLKKGKLKHKLGGT
jgi:hypothetical protein